MHTHWVCSASTCSLMWLEPPPPTSTHLLGQHIPAYTSMALHWVFTPRHCFFSSVSVVWSGNSGLPFAGPHWWVTCHHQEKGFLPPQGTNPTLESQCTKSFYVWKKLFIFGSHQSAARWYVSHLQKGSPPLNKPQKLPPFFSQIADGMFLGKSGLCLSLARSLGSTRRKCLRPWTWGCQGTHQLQSCRAESSQTVALQGMRAN